MDARRARQLRLEPLQGTAQRGAGSAQRGAGTRLRDATVEPNSRRAEILSEPLARFPGQIPTSGAPPPPCSAPRLRDVTAKACVRPRASLRRAPSRSGVASKQTALGTCSALRGILRRLLLWCRLTTRRPRRLILGPKRKRENISFPPSFELAAKSPRSRMGRFVQSFPR
jgi:hypothetical protein